MVAFLKMLSPKPHPGWTIRWVHICSNGDIRQPYYHGGFLENDISLVASQVGPSDGLKDILRISKVSPKEL